VRPINPTTFWEDVIFAPMLVAAAVALPQSDVSRHAGAQDEPTIAASPADPAILLAASNDDQWGTDAFTSTDGGTTWIRSLPLSPYVGADCAAGDPGAAIAADGREFVSYLTAPCASTSPDAPSSVYVSSRAGPSGSWEPVLVADASEGNNDKPALASDNVGASPHHGRAYLVWDRYTSSTDRLVISHSDDGGRTWSVPRLVRGASSTSGTVSVDGLTVGPGGTVYLTWEDDDDVAWVSRSTDGGQSFRASVRVAKTGLPFSRSCEENPESGGGTAIPAQAQRCVDVNASLAVGPARVVVVYTARRRGRHLGVDATSFDSMLRRRSAPVSIRPSHGPLRSDQFLPVAAADRNNGRIWACWYDTRGDATRRSAVFTCSASRDGRRWAIALPVASVRSDESRPPADILQFGDYEGLTVGADGVAHPIWTDSRNLATLGEEIYTTALSPSPPCCGVS
jgi:hypothetical protein